MKYRSKRRCQENRRKEKQITVPQGVAVVSKKINDF
jgi:hypothetical protein